MKSWDELRQAGDWSLARTWYEVYKQFQFWAEEAYKQRGWPEASLAHVHFLVQLEETGTRLTEVARLTGVTKQYAGRQARELEAAGLIESRPDDLDRRAVLVRPTPQGRRFLEDACQVQAELEQRFLGLLGPEKTAGLQQALQILGQAVRGA